MNFKTVLTVALLVSGGSFMAGAQQKSATAKVAAVSQARSFTSKIDAFEKATDKAKEAELMTELKQQIVDGFTASKQEISNAQNSGNTANVEKLTKQLQSRSQLYSKLMQVTSAEPNNKKGAVEILRAFALELK